MQLIPGLRIGTRASNKDKHPGLILLGNPRCTSEEMSQLRAESARHREAEEERLTMAVENVAQIEDMIQELDDVLQEEHQKHRDGLCQ
jgi:hypothetical protein